jgi:hypothetical protein
MRYTFNRENADRSALLKKKTWTDWETLYYLWGFGAGVALPPLVATHTPTPYLIGFGVVLILVSLAGGLYKGRYGGDT